MRLPLAATLHTDRYDDSRLAEAVDDYDRRRDARYSLPRQQQRAPEVFGYAPFYGWSEDKARQAAARPKARASRPICAPAALPSNSRREGRQWI